MKKTRCIVFLFFICSFVAVFAAPNAKDSKEKDRNKNENNEKVVKEEDKKEDKSFKYLSAAIAVGIACIAGGLAVGKIGAAAMGAMSERPEVSGKAIPFVGLAEGICLWGFLVALLIII